MLQKKKLRLVTWFVTSEFTAESKSLDYKSRTLYLACGRVKAGFCGSCWSCEWTRVDSEVFEEQGLGGQFGNSYKSKWILNL